MNKFNSTLILTIVFLCLSTPAAAQTASPSPTPPVDDGNVVKITTNLIQIDAVVTGKDGKTVTDLTAADFEIYENNVKQEITNFSFVSATREKTETIKKPAKDAPTVAAPPPFPNKLRPEQVRRTIALVVDDLGLSFASIDAVKFSLKKFVDEQIQPGDLVAITRTSAGAGALQQFTSDKRMLYAAIGRIRWFPSGRGEVSAFTPVYANPSPHGKSDSDDMPNVD
ncbi:MAG TPA: VWA domain-containing protein, partial [Pyrinomonadaceae bacterium]|nr:VWA domain-containing protein [Pyrinomonadaceae bacterium]